MRQAVCGRGDPMQRHPTKRWRKRSLTLAFLSLSVGVARMDHCLPIVVGFMVVSVMVSPAEDPSKSKAEEWPYGPYDKLHRDEFVIEKGFSPTNTITIIRGVAHSAPATNGSNSVTI